jgi:hypothetical protein
MRRDRAAARRLRKARAVADTAAVTKRTTSGDEPPKLLKQRDASLVAMMVVMFGGMTFEGAIALRRRGKRPRDRT